MEPASLALTAVDPPVARDTATRLVREAYGMQGDAIRLTGERDQNFRIQTDKGMRYLLKVSHSAEHRGAVLLQTAAMQHIARVDPDLPVPRLVPTQSGQSWCEIALPDTRSHIVRLFTLLDGLPLREVRPTERILEQLGRSAARIDLALETFIGELAAPPLLWDLQQAAHLRELLPTVEEQHRTLAQAGLEYFLTEACPVLASCRKRLIHNDLNPSNVLIDTADSSVSGLLDFGDAVRAPLISEIGIAAAYHVAASCYDVRLIAALVRGYCAVLPLQPEEMHLLIPLMVGRLAQTLIITSWRANIHPENAAYIQRNAADAIKGLAMLLEIDKDALTERLVAASSSAAAEA